MNLKEKRTRLSVLFGIEIDNRQTELIDSLLQDINMYHEALDSINTNDEVDNAAVVEYIVGSDNGLREQLRFIIN